ncbi:MAG: hypothetical protein NTW19_05470 [Planctomycetota bacterium]|nr:hypothetical protein [Planctomycetota bacterium]
MRWLFFAIFAYLALALDLGLRSLLAIDAGVGPITPSLTLILAVYVGLWAPSRAVAWAFLILGAATDLLSFWPASDPGQPLGNILGPTALAYLVGAYAIIQIRGFVYRESTLAMAVVAFGVGAVIHLVAMLLLTLRGLPFPLGEPIPNWHVADEFIRRFLSLLYTAVAAVPVGMAFNRIYPGAWIDPLKGAHTFRR